jgi:hypothetical protein
MRDRVVLIEKAEQSLAQNILRRHEGPAMTVVIVVQAGTMNYAWRFAG